MTADDAQQPLDRLLDQQLWDLVYAYDAAYDRAARDHDLSAAQACLLGELISGSRTMGELARALLCDASNVTQLAARLESRGLLTRAVDPDDRRVKRLAVTTAGRRAHRRVRAGFVFPGERLGRLDAAERDQLAGLLARLLESTDPGS